MYRIFYLMSALNGTFFAYMLYQLPGIGSNKTPDKRFINERNNKRIITVFFDNFYYNCSFNSICNAGHNSQFLILWLNFPSPLLSCFNSQKNVFPPCSAKAGASRKLIIRCIVIYSTYC